MSGEEQLAAIERISDEIFKARTTINLELAEVRKALDRLAGVIAASALEQGLLLVSRTGVDPGKSQPVLTATVNSVLNNALDRHEAVRE